MSRSESGQNVLLCSVVFYCILLCSIVLSTIFYNLEDSSLDDVMHCYWSVDCTATYYCMYGHIIYRVYDIIAQIVLDYSILIRHSPSVIAESILCIGRFYMVLLAVSSRKRLGRIVSVSVCVVVV